MEKYHLLPDNLENLQSQFGFLKQATSKNTEHLQQAITVQQAYAANLCTYINNILLCVTKLEETILQLEQKISMDADINLINRHNTHSESERIRREYTQYLLDLSDNQDYYKENPINQLQYSIPDPDYYGTPMRWSQKTPHDPNSYYPPPPDPADIQHWHAHGKRKMYSPTWLEREDQIRAMNEKAKFLTFLLLVYL